MVRWRSRTLRRHGGAILHWLFPLPPARLNLLSSTTWPQNPHGMSERRPNGHRGYSTVLRYWLVVPPIEVASLQDKSHPENRLEPRRREEPKGKAVATDPNDAAGCWKHTRAKTPSEEANRE